MNILFFGDVVGEPGRKALYRALPELRAEFAADAVVVNGENAAGGRGITPALCREFFEHGADVITLGDHAWDQQEIFDYLDREPRVLRPFNHPADTTPGKGSILVDTPAGKLGVLCLCGRTFMRPGLDNPFTLGYAEAERLRAEGAAAVFTDMHGEATSEKIAMALRLDGVASAVIGTHTHVQTADERLLPGGTAALTDAGMCGSRDGVIGRDAEAVVQAAITTLPCKLPVGGWPAVVCGVAVTVGSDGRASSITRINRVYEK